VKLPPTEGEHPESGELDVLPTAQLVELLASDHRNAVDAVLAQSETIATVVDVIVQRLAHGGRLHYVGAGSSGRIATLDASEMPPTFGTPPDLVNAHMAGGEPALRGPVEGAEDDAAAGDAAMRDGIDDGDAVIGVSASGSAPYVVAAIERASAIGAYTVALTAVADSPLAGAAAIAIAIPTGAEVLSGSTRLKAATAAKIALNTISTAVMVRLGKVHGNLMVDVVAANEKLRARALRLVQRLANVDEDRAADLLRLAHGRVKVAVVMQRCDADPLQAESLLIARDGRLRSLL
jgi:N-acetylmuramic acid 6-phosphate etherase